MENFDTGDIVEMSDKKGHFGESQGLVIQTDDRGVAVFFDQEVSWSSLWQNSYKDKPSRNCSLTECKPENCKIKDSETGCDTCYRICFFHPSELQKSTGWKNEAVATREFGEHWHTLREHRGLNEPGYCRAFGCHQRWQKVTLINCWGVVCAIPTCAEHYKQYHGRVMDELPEELTKKTA